MKIKIGDTLRYCLLGIMLVFFFVTLSKHVWPIILRAYVETGIGSCGKIPILCMGPAEATDITVIDKEYIKELLPYDSPKIKMLIPKGFAVVQERIKKVYYKKQKRAEGEAVMYILYEEPGFFINLFPQVKKQGIKDNYDFIKRTMHAKVEKIKSLTDAFFVIMKSIFIPDLGDQAKATMSEFSLSGKKAFINYNLSKPDSFFDCNIIGKGGDFLKIYIKDRGAKLDLKKVQTIISTVKTSRNN